MRNVPAILYNIIKQDLKYLYIKNLSPKKYESFIEKEYKRRTGQDLNLEKPEKYTEKMQYAKLYLNTPLKTNLSDKYLVREWVEEKIGENYLIPLLGAWDKFSEINFDELPNQFVLKLNSGSGTNIVVKDKSQFDLKKSKMKFDRWLAKNFAFSGDIQLHYKDIKPKIIAEEYIEDSDGELKDYKFLCFDGKVFYCWVDIGRQTTHYRNVYDLDWNLQPWKQHYYDNSPHQIEKPENFDEMVDIAKTLCEGFSHTRVDLYNVNGRIYFGEMTFTNGSGHELIHPEKYNYMLGDLWELDNK